MSGCRWPKSGGKSHIQESQLHKLSYLVVNLSKQLLSVEPRQHLLHQGYLQEIECSFSTRKCETEQYLQVFQWFSVNIIFPPVIYLSLPMSPVLSILSSVLSQWQGILCSLAVPPTVVVPQPPPKPSFLSFHSSTYHQSVFASWIHSIHKSCKGRLEGESL